MLAIDLGPGHAAAASLEVDGIARVVPDADGHDLTAAWVWLADADDAVFGEEARKVALLEDADVLPMVPARLGEAGARLTRHGRTWTVQELVARLLRQIADHAAAARGEDVHEIALALPSWFDTARRAAAQEAVDIAGLTCRTWLDRPVAALLGHGLGELPDPARILVVHAGDLALEATVVERSARRLRVAATRSERGAGGIALTEAVGNGLLARWQAAHPNADPLPMTTPEARQALADTVRGLLRATLVRPEATVAVGPSRHRVTVDVDRDLLLGWTEQARLQLQRPVHAALHAAGISPRDVDVCVLLGAHARLPGLDEAVQAVIGAEVTLPDQPHTLAARGLAWFAMARHHPHDPALRRRRPPPRPVAAASMAPVTRPAEAAGRHVARLGLADGGHAAAPPYVPPEAAAPEIDVAVTASRSLGIVVLDARHQERVETLIPEGTALPARFRGHFTYAHDGMTSVRIDVTEGTGAQREDVRVVATVSLTGLPPRPRGTPIEVSYRLSREQVLTVRVADVETGAWKDARVEHRGALTADELAAARVRTRTRGP